VAGARVSSTKPVAYNGLSEKTQTAWTDVNGRFTLNDLRRGMTTLIANAGPGGAISVYERLSVGSDQSAVLQLPELPRRSKLALEERTRSEPLRTGQAAVAWHVGPWSDGRPHELADDRGRVVLLYFWGTDFRQSVEALPALAKLAARFEPRGVGFRAIHRPAADEKRTLEDARRALALKQIRLTYAIDQVRIEGHSRGVTAQQYGVNHYPAVILIDRTGKIAFRSDEVDDDRNVAAVFMRILTDPQEMTEEKADRLVERAIAEEIESLLKRKD
jgi:hypothetical protein